MPCFNSFIQINFLTICHNFKLLVTSLLSFLLSCWQLFFQTLYLCPCIYDHLTITNIHSSSTVYIINSHHRKSSRRSSVKRLIMNYDETFYINLFTGYYNWVIINTHIAGSLAPCLSHQPKLYIYRYVISNSNYIFRDTW